MDLIQKETYWWDREIFIWSTMLYHAFYDVATEILNYCTSFDWIGKAWEEALRTDKDVLYTIIYEPGSPLHSTVAYYQYF